MSKRLLLPLLTALSLIALAAPSASAQDKIVCAYPFWPGFAPLHLAKELGYFEEEGLEVTETFDDDRGNVLPALERGDINCSMRTIGEYQGRPRKPDTEGTIIGTIDLSLGGDGVVADGSVKSAADLKGKTVAVEPNVPARLLLQFHLKKAGLTLDDLDVRDIASADAIAVFADPQIAAVGTYEPTLSQTLKASGKEGASILVSSADYPGLITDAIIARTTDLKENPEQYAKLLRGIYRAIDYFKANRDEAIKILAPHYRLSVAEFEETLEGLRYTDYEESLELMGKPGERGTLHQYFDDVMQLNIENGAADTVLKADEEIDNSLINGLFDGKKR